MCLVFVSYVNHILGLVGLSSAGRISPEAFTDSSCWEYIQMSSCLDFRGMLLIISIPKGPSSPMRSWSKPATSSKFSLYECSDPYCTIPGSGRQAAHRLTDIARCVQHIQYNYFPASIELRNLYTFNRRGNAGPMSRTSRRRCSSAPSSNLLPFAPKLRRRKHCL